MTTKREIIQTSVAVVCVIIAFNIGMIQGARIATNEIIDIGLKYINIELSERALLILRSNPKILNRVIENMPIMITENNTFLGHPQAELKWEECMLYYGNKTQCDYSVGIKYGY